MRRSFAATAMLVALSGSAFAQAQVGPVQVDGGLYVVPSGASGASITPVVSMAAESSHVLKSSGGNLYSVYATNLTTTCSVWKCNTINFVTGTTWSDATWTPTSAANGKFWVPSSTPASSSDYLGNASCP